MSTTLKMHTALPSSYLKRATTVAVIGEQWPMFRNGFRAHFVPRHLGITPEIRWDPAESSQRR